MSKPAPQPLTEKDRQFLIRRGLIKQAGETPTPAQRGAQTREALKRDAKVGDQIHGEVVRLFNYLQR